MGKGDRKSRKAKIWMGSYGNTRPRKRRKKAVTAAASTAKKQIVKKKPAKKAKTEE